MVSRFVGVLVALVAVGINVSSAQSVPGVGRTFGYVPDAAKAIRIAVSVWEPIYGKKQIASERPFHATLKNGIWHVEGYLPPRFLGGVAEAEIRRSDGKVLHIEHGL